MIRLNTTKALNRMALMMIIVPLLASCATVSRGTHTFFIVKTNPLGAKVVLSTGQSCPSTPCSFTMPRYPGFTITVSKAGYKTETIDIKSEINGHGGGALAGNVLAGGLIGMSVDSANGSLNDLVPNPVDITLVPETGPIAPSSH